MWVAAAIVPFACSQILLFSFGRDQGVYAVIADKMLAGGMPYRDAWDIHPLASILSAITIFRRNHEPKRERRD
jgi:hypothetical protein